MSLNFGASASALCNVLSGKRWNAPTIGTLAFWFNLTTITTRCRMLGGDAGLGDYEVAWGDSANSVEFYVPRATTYCHSKTVQANFATSIATNKWLFYCSQWDTTVNANNKQFIGDLASLAAEPSSYSVQTAGSGTFQGGNGTILIGNNAGLTLHVPGKMDYFLFVPRLITLQEIRRYQRRLVVPSGVGIYIPFGAKGAGIQEDLSRNGANGSNSLASVGDSPPIQLNTLKNTWYLKRILRTVTQDVTTDSAITTTDTTDVTTTGVTTTIDTTDVTSTGAISTTGTTDVTSTSAISATQNSDVVTDSAISQTVTQDVTSTGAITATEITDVTTDSAITATGVQDVTTDSVITAVVTSDVTTDSAIQNTVTSDVSTDSAIQAPASTNVTTDSSIQVVETTDVTSTAAVKTTDTTDVTSSASLTVGGIGTMDVDTDSVITTTNVADITTGAVVILFRTTDIQTTGVITNVAIKDVPTDASIVFVAEIDVATDASISVNIGQFMAISGEIIFVPPF